MLEKINFLWCKIGTRCFSPGRVEKKNDEPEFIEAAQRPSPIIIRDRTMSSDAHVSRNRNNVNKKFFIILGQNSKLR